MKITYNLFLLIYCISFIKKYKTKYSNSNQTSLKTNQTGSLPDPNPMWFSINSVEWQVGFLRLLHSFVHRPKPLCSAHDPENMVLSPLSLSILKHLFFFLFFFVRRFMLKFHILFWQTKRTKKAGIVGKYGTYSCFNATWIL